MTRSEYFDSKESFVNFFNIIVFVKTMNTILDPIWSVIFAMPVCVFNSLPNREYSFFM